MNNSIGSNTLNSIGEQSKTILTVSEFDRHIMLNFWQIKPDIYGCIMYSKLFNLSNSLRPGDNICVSTTIDSENGFLPAPSHHLNQYWTIVNWALGKNFREIFKKMHLKLLSGNCPQGVKIYVPSISYSLWDIYAFWCIYKYPACFVPADCPIKF